ncbi:MAG: DUF58 domain-containing protein [Nitrospira sp. BO4]|nr:DUF58 domain-containing protein [Nitrospira sp. BO4]
MPLQSPSFVRRMFRHRSTRVTSVGIQFLIFTLAIGAAAINTGNNLFYLLLAMMLSLILVSGIVAEYCLRRLEFHRHLPDLLFVNEPVTATLVVKNRKSRLPSFSLKVFDVSDGRDLDRGVDVPQLPPGGSRLLSYPLIATRRGRLQLEGVRIATEFPFGLFMKKAFYQVEGTAVACPEIKPLEDHLLRGLHATGQEQSVYRRGHGNDLYNLRLYQAGDDSRSIHWPTTARTSQLTVRETEAEDQRRAVVHLPTIAPISHDALFERAVSLTASIVHYLAHRGYLFRLLLGTSRSSFGQGEAHYFELLRMLALCERSSPTTQVVLSEGPSADCPEVEGGALIVVRSWRGPEDVKAEDLTLLINGEMLGGVSHVL